MWVKLGLGFKGFRFLVFVVEVDGSSGWGLGEVFISFFLYMV